MNQKLLSNNHFRGIIHILLSALFFSLMSFFVRLSGDVPTMQKAFFRNAIAAVIATYILIRSGDGFKVPKDSWVSLFLRSAFGTTGLILNFWAIDHLGIADSNMLNKMSPFFAIIMSIFILSEIPSRFEILSVIIALIGSAFVIKPSMGLASIPALVGLLGGFCAGTAYTFLRKIGTHGVKGPKIVFYFSMFSTIVCLPYLLLNYHPMSGIQLLYLLLAGSCAAVAQLNITAAYTFAPAKDISVFDYTQVLFAAILGILFLGDIPDVFSFIGYAIIIGTAIIKWYISLKRSK